MPGKTAILIVNGFDRRGLFGPYEAEKEARLYPWIDLCLRQIHRWSETADYRILVFDNSGLPEHLEVMRSYDRVRVFPAEEEKSHQEALDSLVGMVEEDVEHVLVLDNDAFPVRAGWIEELTSALEDGAALAGVWRDEMAPVIRPFIHPSCLCIRRRDLLALNVSFARGITQDVGQNLTEAMLAAGRRLHPLRRSNVRNFHFLLGGLYGDLIYHQGAGNRRAKFWTSTDLELDERTRVALRNAAFRDIDHLVAVLRGEAEAAPTL